MVIQNYSKQVVIHVDVRKEFSNKYEFTLHEHILEWACKEAIKLGFDIVIGTSISDFNIRHAFVTMRCKRSGQYKEHIWKFKRDDIRTKKCGCPLKLCEHQKANNTWTNNVIYDVNNHGLGHKLVGHSIVYLLNT